MAKILKIITCSRSVQLVLNFNNFENLAKMQKMCLTHKELSYFRTILLTKNPD